MNEMRNYQKKSTGLFHCSSNNFRVNNGDDYNVIVAFQAICNCVFSLFFLCTHKKRSGLVGAIIREIENVLPFRTCHYAKRTQNQ